MKLSTTFLTALAAVGYTYTIPQATVKTRFPKGMSISIPHDPGLSSVTFHIRINKKFDGIEDGQITANIKKPIDGLWFFKSKYTPIREGDIMYYWILAVHEGRTYNLIDQFFVFTHYQDGE
ncbi:hypothetical protein NQ176_g11322 [Zarea fungicola]|uniref:Uncharacterized protein n=1 Tax=Zarea fungicola TaxID=93591 RepID=A0ACC1MB56_9HYPO|nr:hypothetical protein NQ176_g11322 [Lecanicillium fungicola]